MKVALIKKLTWDEWNISHLKRYGVKPAEVEQSIKDQFVVFIQGHSNRVMLLGRSGKRLITTVLQQQETKSLCYVVTARDMAKKERVIYRKEKARKEQNDK